MATLEGWPVYLWAGALLLSILAASVTAASGRAPLAVLTAAQVAGATLVGLFGWQTLTNVPGLITGYWDLTAGLGNVDGIEPQQVFLVGQIVFMIACAVAVYAILRRARWGAVLGIGLAAAQIIWFVSIMIHNWSMYDSMPGDVMLDIMLGALGAQVVPALAAIIFLAWPVTRADGEAVPDLTRGSDVEVA
jgi:hypothetical protein